MTITLNQTRNEIIIRNTHRGLLYEDGRMIKVLDAGRYAIPKRTAGHWFQRQPVREVVLVDMRERELTIKGQEILTADKVAIRVSILVQFRVLDAELAIHAVESYEERLYSDVQLAARRSLAAMSLDEILTNRNRLSEEILADVQDAATGYGVAIRRADVKDLIFPGNLQEIMNRVLATERNSEAQLVEARTRAEVDRIEAESRSANRIREAQSQAEADKFHQIAQAEVAQAKSKLDVELFARQADRGKLLEQIPALLRLEELKALTQLAENANAQIYFGEVPGTGKKSD